MGITQEQLAKIIQHNASTLCSESGQKKIRNMGGAIKTDDYGMVSDEWDNFSLSDPMDTPTQQKPSVNLNKSISENAVQRSRMPDAIKQSMLENQIDTSSFYTDNTDTSFLDKLGKNKQQIREQQIPIQQYQQIPQTSVDYSIIKMIVKECLNEYFSNQSLNESTTLKQIGLSEGKIKLVDNKGNVYGADLEFKGNLNERKKK